MNSEILVYIEHRDNQITDICRQLVARGREIADALNTKVNAVIIGDKLDSISKEMVHLDIDSLFMVDNDQLSTYNPEIFRFVLTNLFSKLQPGIVLCGDTYNVRELFPAVALRLGVPFFSSCTSIGVSEGRSTVVQGKYGGIVHAEFEVVPIPSPLIVSLQNSPITAKPSPEHKPAVVPVEINIDIENVSTRMLDEIHKTDSGDDITKADIVISGGRGLGKKENISLIEELAEAVGGVFSCSRPLWDMGWLPESRVVGMSGKTISPKLYLACGISGASQHVMGMSGAKCVVAINKDADAPIFRVAHFGVVGDILELLPAITAEARKARGG